MAPSASPTTKRYLCTKDGCGKGFTRSDHLRRHLLNHEDGGSTCPRCSLHFKRADLLDRHMLRHQQKDNEAGGEGLGIIETRKRLWRDADGNIVSKRPLSSNSAATSPGRTEVGTAAEGPRRSINANGAQMAVRPEPLSPPSSMSSVDHREQASRKEFNLAPDQNLLAPAPAPDMCDFLANSSWDFHPSRSLEMRPDVPFDDMFNPDTASSFNMPFTTMNNYNWLFGVNDAMSIPMDACFPDVSSWNGQATSISSDMQATPYISPNDFETGASGSNGNTCGNVSTNPSVIESHRYPFTSGASRPEHGEFSEAHHLSGFGHLLTPSSSTAPHSLSSAPQHPDRLQMDTPPSLNSVSISTDEQPGARLVDIHNFHQQVSVGSNLPSGQHRKVRPMIDEVVRQDILDLLSAGQPMTPDGSHIDGRHPLLTIACLQDYLDLFFSRFNTIYPLLHQATFEPSRTQPLLVLAVLLLGATYSEKDVHMLSVCIHDVLRALIFQHPTFSASPDLWMLQTILLVECFGKSRAGQKQHDMAHLFHGLLINLIRRSDCQTVRQPVFDRDSVDVDTMWRKAIDVEMRKRLAFLCFLWDTQHAVLFSQSLCMSSFELRTTLPCNETTWEATTAEEWWHHARKEPRIPYLSVLKAYMNSELETDLPPLNFFSRLLALHGLMSIQWDMKRRDQTSLGVADQAFAGSSESTRWQHRLARSYDAWKADFDTYCMDMTLSLSDCSSKRTEFVRSSTVTTAIYHAAHITLNVEILDLQIYAGARHILGRPITLADYERSRRAIKDWARPDGPLLLSSNAVSHAAHLLKDGIMNMEDWDISNAFHFPWCLYLATLTCWAFHFANVVDKSDSNHTVGSHDAQHSGDSSGGDALQKTGLSNGNPRSEMISLVCNITNVKPEHLWRVVGRNSSAGLIRVISKHLSNVRWAVVHEGMKVLRGLLNERNAGGA